MKKSQPDTLVERARRRAVPPFQHTRRLLHDLRMLVFEITQRCNLACRHCGSDCTRSSVHPDLALADIVRVLDEVRVAWPKRPLTIMLGGGEPLLHPDVWRIGRACRERGFSWGMVTNGALWDDDAFESAYKAGIRSVSVSLDGLPEEHDWLRGKAGSQALAVQTIRRLLADDRIGPMDVITCVTPRSLAQLDQIFDLVRSLDAPGWRLIPISPIGRARGNAELLLDREGWRQLLRKILEYRAVQGRMPVYLSESNYVGGCLDLKVRDHHFFCQAGVSIGGIMVDGAILACANIDRRLAQGNIHTDSFVDAWENRFELFRDRRWMRTGRCQGCGEWIHCQGNSLHNWDLDANQPAACQFADFDLGDFPEAVGVPIVRRRPGPRRE